MGCFYGFCEPCSFIANYEIPAIQFRISMKEVKKMNKRQNPADLGKIKVGFFFGGRSVEHEVSVISGLQAMYAINTEKYAPVPVYISKEGHMYTGGRIGEIEAYSDIPALLSGAERVNLVAEKGHFYLVRYPEKKFSNNILAELEVAFPVVHGTNVEDGSLQGYFKIIGIPFVGCDVTASAIGMDKAATKAVLKPYGIPVLDCVCVSGKSYYDAPDETLARVEGQTSYPVIVKPLNLGSSVGITKAADRAALRRAIEHAFSFAETALIENAVQNLKEINCAVLGDIDGAEASVCEEPVGSDEILSYADKYVGGSKGEGAKTGAKCGSKTGGSKGSSGMATLKRKIPAEIPAEIEQRVKDYSVRAFAAIGCAGVTRIDYLYDTVSGALYLNELNTIPGSLAYYLWEASGVPFAELLDRLIRLAFKRARKEDNLNFSFDTNILKGVTLGRGAKG